RAGSVAIDADRYPVCTGRSGLAARGILVGRDAAVELSAGVIHDARVRVQGRVHPADAVAVGDAIGRAAPGLVPTGLAVNLREAPVIGRDARRAPIAPAQRVIPRIATRRTAREQPKKREATAATKDPFVAAPHRGGQLTRSPRPPIPQSVIAWGPSFIRPA